MLITGAEAFGAEELEGLEVVEGLLEDEVDVDGGAFCRGAGLTPVSLGIETGGRESLEGGANETGFCTGEGRGISNRLSRELGSVAVLLLLLRSPVVVGRGKTPGK